MGKARGSGRAAGRRVCRLAAGASAASLCSLLAAALPAARLPCCASCVHKGGAEGAAALLAAGHLGLRSTALERSSRTRPQRQTRRTRCDLAICLPPSALSSGQHFGLAASENCFPDVPCFDRRTTGYGAAAARMGNGVANQPRRLTRGLSIGGSAPSPQTTAPHTRCEVFPATRSRLIHARENANCCRSVESVSREGRAVLQRHHTPHVSTTRWRPDITGALSTYLAFTQRQDCSVHCDDANRCNLVFTGVLLRIRHVRILWFRNSVVRKRTALRIFLDLT